MSEEEQGGVRDGRAWGAALLVVIWLGMWLRAQGITAGFWLDEIANVGAPGRPGVGALFVVPIITARSPLFFGWFPAWLALAGDGELAARWPALLCGVIGIALIYRVGCELFGPRAGALAGLLLACNPLHVWYSREASFYTFVTALALASTWLFTRQMGWARAPATPRPARRGLWVLYGASTGLLLASSPWAIWLVLAQVVTALFAARHDRARWRGFWAASAVACVVSAPALAVYVQGASASWSAAATRPAVPFVEGGYALLALAWGFAAGPPPEALREALETGGDVRVLLAAHAAWLVLAAVGLAWLAAGAWLLEGWQRRRRPVSAPVESGKRAPGARAQVGFLALWLGLSLAGTDALAWLANTNFNVRYVLLALPALLLWCARRQAVVAAVVCACALFFLARQSLDPAFAQEDLRAPARFLQVAAPAGDLVVLRAPQSYLTAPLTFYGSVPAAVKVWNVAVPDAGRAAQAVRDWSDGHCRVWLWSARAWQVDASDLVPRTLAEQAAPAGHWRWPGSEVAVFERAGCP